jgi:alkylhydroperoxidase family enzyme
VPALPAAILRPLHPEAVDALEHAHAAAQEAVPDPATFELCRLLAAAILGDEDAAPRVAGLDPVKAAAVGEWWRSDAFTEAERAHLAFTERFVTQVGAMSDDDVEALLAHAEPLAVYTFISALYVEEFRMRLGMVAGAVLGGDAA